MSTRLTTLKIKNNTYSLNNKSMDTKQSVYNGLLMTAGILGSTFVVKKIKKDMAPQLSVGSAVSLGTVTILSKIALDYAQDPQRRWIPDKI